MHLPNNSSKGYLVHVYFSFNGPEGFYGKPWYPCVKKQHFYAIVCIYVHFKEIVSYFESFY